MRGSFLAMAAALAAGASAAPPPEPRRDDAPAPPSYRPTRQSLGPAEMARMGKAARRARRGR